MNDDLPQEVVDRYVEAVNGRDAAALAMLFAPHAVMLHPMGSFDGSAAIMDFYRNVVFAFETRLVPRQLAAGDHSAVLELEAHTPHAEKVQYAVDWFELDAAGRIARLAVYYR